ncbi:MAG: dNTP triphosphohydrolase, partial [Spirochaetia bacterium]|nr:dNTP triphosphohydrolase [Spirochaetia bacterium]
MLPSINELERKEDALLASYAVKHSLSGGRIFAENSQEQRTCYQRDRDRIIHSKAFRRLGYKTQVFVNSEGDMFRTRLTHSLEVAQLSRSVTAYLNLNSDYAEALALAHDMGHSPFGHAGQEALDTLMKKHGGFEHNCQTLRIVSALETRYLEWNGLNLTRLTLFGMLKHPRVYENDTQLREILHERKGKSLPLEAGIVDTCDRLAYLHHDFEDGLDSGFLEADEVLGLPAFQVARTALEKTHGPLFSKARFPLRARMLVRFLMNECITDLIENIQRNLSSLKVETMNDVLILPHESYPVSNSKEMKERLTGMQKFLFARLYRHPNVLRMSRRGERIIENLFSEYCSRPEMMPE